VFTLTDCQRASNNTASGVSTFNVSQDARDDLSGQQRVTRRSKKLSGNADTRKIEW